jgi:hypothetical protein
MSFDPVQFVILARATVDNLALDAEARSRGAIGRAYYALFLAVRVAIFQSKGAPIDGRLSHGRLTDVLFDSGNEDFLALAQTLQSLYDARQHADYRLDPPPPWDRKVGKPSNAKAYVKRAEGALREIRKLDFTPIAHRL